MADEARPAPLFRFWYGLAWLFAWFLFKILGPVRVRGAYRVPRSGGVLVLANHLSDIDPVVLQYASPRHMRFMAKSELFAMRGVGSMLRFFQAFPVSRGEPDRKSLRLAVDLLKAGEPVAIFPEGQLSEDGELQELKPGVALIARHSGAPVICCGLSDTPRMMPYGHLLPRPAFHAVWARWGETRVFGKDATTEEILGWAEGQLRMLLDER